ncbi:MAG: V-type ATPase subunit [Candidatus Marsarchaeota archaeon]|nr:V-type ATPase subunit [Candidatus Marsarchaeota archaeon]MCL5112022.1 V-type ATPase subunit [Candidatus Marsarchaeota archaeon]
MDSTYTGAYGRLKGLRQEFLSLGFIEQLEQKDIDEFVKALSATGYRKEIDELSALYKEPDLLEVVINAHMMRMSRNSAFAIPPLARNIVAAFIGRYDIENIKTILSSKKLGYGVEQTEAFLTVQRNVPVGIFAGLISREDYTGIVAQKDIEGVVNYIVRFGYGTPLLKHLDEARKGDISNMLMALDLYYYTRLLDAFRFYVGNEGILLSFIKGLIDIRNIMTVIKGIELGGEDVKGFIIKGGDMQESRLVEMSQKKVEALAQYMPFKIDDAFELYKGDQFASYFEAALRRELYKKYLKLFNESGISAAQIVGFMLRSEIERDELRRIWMGKYYKVSKERIEHMGILKYVV